MTTPNAATCLPVCVDLDGTLIYSDLLLESLMLLVKRNPLYLLLLPFWLLKGRAACKEEIARRVELDPAALPYNEALIAWLKNEPDRGCYLVTAANERLARLVAAHTGLFSDVMASSPALNLKGATKADALAARFGERGFVYCGNEDADLPVWRRAGAAVVVSDRPTLASAVAQVAPVRATFAGRSTRPGVWASALRPHQWTKNLLLFVPLVAGHQFSDHVIWLQATLGFIAFCLCASSVYVLNDLLDLQSDRQHPTKSRRPFASGRLSIAWGALLVPGLLLLAVAAAWPLPERFLTVLTTYYALTLAYSFRLKRYALIDTFVLAALYTMRILAGTAAAAIGASFWMLLFSVFIFYSLALVKRYAELTRLARAGKLRASGRNYGVEDLAIIQMQGIASGFVCVLVLALYINTPQVVALYRHPNLIGAVCVLLLYWISRIWMQAHRGQMLEDPVVYAVTDRTSLLTILAVLAVVWLAM